MYRWLVLGWILPLAGCLGGSYQPDVYVAVEPMPVVEPATPTGLTLGVRPLEAPVMLRRPMVYRDGTYKLQTYDAALWAQEPAQVMTRALMGAVRASGRYADVAPATALRMPTHMLTGAIEHFEEVRDGSGARAVCEVRVEVRDQATGNLVYGATLEASAPLTGVGHEAYAAAMSEAAAEIITQALAGIAAS